jgi:hypothetical protein
LWGLKIREVGDSSGEPCFAQQSPDSSIPGFLTPQRKLKECESFELTEISPSVPTSHLEALGGIKISLKNMH